MTRDDHIRATVAAGMQDSGVIREAIAAVVEEAFRKGDQAYIFADIAHHLASASASASHAHREFRAMRLFNTLETYARAALTAKAEDDLPQPDDEENDDG